MTYQQAMNYSYVRLTNGRKSTNFKSVNHELTTPVQSLLNTYLFRKKKYVGNIFFLNKKENQCQWFSKIKLRFQISLTFHSLWHPVCRVGLYIRSVEERVKTADRLRVLNWKKVVCKYREAVTQVSSHCYIYYYTTHTTWTTTQSTQMTI